MYIIVFYWAHFHKFMKDNYTVTGRPIRFIIFAFSILLNLATCRYIVCSWCKNKNFASQISPLKAYIMCQFINNKK